MKVVITKVIQRLDNVNSDLVTNDDYVAAAEANITLGAASGDILAVEIAGSAVRGESSVTPMRLTPSTGAAALPSKNPAE